MRNQAIIYDQIENVNYNISSDICTFQIPNFEISGATKLISGMTESDESVYFINSPNFDLSLIFNFNQNLSDLRDESIFNYSIFKFDYNNLSFNHPNFFISEDYQYSEFKSTNILSGFTSLNIIEDSEFIIKPNWLTPNCTNILNRLGYINKSSSFSNDSEFYLYNNVFDNYFAVIYSASTPNFSLTPNSQKSIGSLNSISFISSGETTFFLDNGLIGNPIVTLNGNVLAQDLDFSIVNNNQINLFNQAQENDVVTLFYVGKGGKNGLVIDSFSINKSILSGSINNQGVNKFYYNTTTSKHEIYLDVTPNKGNDFLLSLNGNVLANGLDYHLSTSNNKRIILEVNLEFGDVVNIVYNGNPTFVGNVNKKELEIYWTIEKHPNKNNGYFNLQLSNTKTFSNIIDEVIVNYEIANKVYNGKLTLSGGLGDKLYYRVVNNKVYKNILGDEFNSTAISEIIPIIITSNIDNNY
jgi:hypothetical protein